jgi:4-oxalocrotonate tautomerase
VPIVEVKAFAPRFEDNENNERLIAAVTNALCEVFGEEVRGETWVILDPVARENWGFGGKVRH